MTDPTRTASPGDGTPTRDADPALTLLPPDGQAFPGPALRTERYTLARVLARGGMGEVHLARDTVLNREVAVKVLRDGFGSESAAARRFDDEARITGQLQHPAIPPVHDLGVLPDGRPFLAMKLVKGETLDRLLKDRADLAEDRGRFVAVFEAICQAVAYAHAHKVVHRDLKPLNVMVGAFGEVQVMDWGLAKVLGSRHAGGDPQETAADTAIQSVRDVDTPFTQAGSVLGTPAFMPPEQAAGAVGKIDTRSDVFGLGAILAVVLTGQPPFTGGTAETTRVMAAQGKVQDCYRRLDACGADPELVALCKRCLAAEQGDRPPDADAVATAVAALRAAADERARQADLERVRVQGEKAQAEAMAAEQRKRRRVLAAGAGLLVAGLGLFVAVQWRNARKLEGEQARTGAAKELAESRLGQVVDTWYTQIITVQNELDGQAVSPAFRLRLLRSAEQRLAEILCDQPRTRSTDHMLHVLYRRMADAERESGELEAALGDIAEAKRIAELRYAEDPDGPDSRRDLADASLTLGDIRAERGDTAGALAAYADADAHLAAHLGTHPDDHRAEGDRVKLAGRRGTLLLRAGREAEARTALANALRLAREAVAAHPGDPAALALLLVSLKTAAITTDDDADDALVAEALTLAEKLSHADPTNRRRLADRADLQYLLGEAANKRHRRADARRWYDGCLVLRLELASGANTSPEALYDLATVYERLGDLDYADAKYPAAAVRFTEAVRVAEQLTLLKPNRAVRTVLGNLLVRLGATRVLLGDTAAARDCLRRCLESRSRLADGDNPDADAVYALAETHRVLADLEKHPAVLDFARAEGHYREAERLLLALKRRGQLDPKKPERQTLLRDSAWGATYCGRVVRVLEDPAAAASYPPPEAFPLLIARMRVRAKAGDAKGAADSGDRIRGLRPTDGGYLAGAARGYALAVAAETNAAAKKGYLRKSVELLNAANSLGADLRALTSDPDFAAFRAALAPPIPPAVR